MSPAVQAKLLRVLEESSFERVGGTRKIHVDIRVIAATNQDLETLIARGAFRSDLFYRINTISVVLPPLRDRPEDIPALVEHFVVKYAKKYRKPVEGVEDALMERWKSHTWPGNVRELQNAVNQAVLLSSGRLLGLSAEAVTAIAQKPVGTETTRQVPAVTTPSCPCGGLEPDSFRGLKEYSDAVVARCERAAILRTLERENWNRSAAARALDVTRKTLATKMVEYGISAPHENPS
jgi:two-component system response regulator AtoC